MRISTFPNIKRKLLEITDNEAMAAENQME